MKPGKCVLWLLLWSGAAVCPAVASEADAVAISRNIQARHLPWGTILDPVYASPSSDQIVGYTRCGDSAIWTGHYLAAEAYRYKVTGSAEALRNVQAALAGIKSLVDVTGTDLLARCAFPAGSPYAASITAEESHNGIYTSASGGLQWVGNTSRDQYSGVFFGLALAYDMVADEGVKAAASSLATRMLNFLIDKSWTVAMPGGSVSTTFLIRADQQLALLQIGKHLNPAAFTKPYSDLTGAFLFATSVYVPVSLEVQDNSSYFKFNLDYINFFNTIRLGGSVASSAYGVLRQHTAGHQNAFFNMIDAALNGPNTARDQETVQLLNVWLTRPVRDVPVDLRGSLPSCGSQSEACNPVPVAMRPTTDFLWQRDPFLLNAPNSGMIEGAGIDYILPFWMARYYGVTDATSVVSSATGAPVVAAESIATVYGSGLAGGTAAAASLPLPLNLGGDSVQVTGSDGVMRPAPLFYVGPGQLNFEIPAGTPPGRAAVAVSSGAATVASTTVAVSALAPALFTADGTGSGVAAGLSLTANSPAAPVFQCSGSACTPVPIVLTGNNTTFVLLFGTGIRNRSATGTVIATAGTVSLPVIYGGPQGTEAGLDQVNLTIPATLRGAGELLVTVTVDGHVSNTVLLNFK